MPKKPPPEGWRNRIVESGEEKPDQLLANPKNWRIHPGPQQEALTAALDEVGWVSRVIVNKQTGFVVDGHLRVALAISRGEATIPVDYVDLTPSEEALILATFDPLSAMAGVDDDLLTTLLDSVETDDERLKKLIRDIGDDLIRSRVPYTQEITAPIYEPSERVPPVEDLYDAAKEKKLTKAISAALRKGSIGEDEAEFLTAAARRHTAFRYDLVADYYASAKPAMQRLMERSALVIIDAKQAISEGFMTLASEIQQSYESDHPDA